MREPAQAIEVAADFFDLAEHMGSVAALFERRHHRQSRELQLSLEEERLTQATGALQGHYQRV